MSTDQTTVPVELLFRLEANLGSMAHLTEVLAGTRTIVNVTGGRFEGPRLRGIIEAPAGDWLTLRGDWTFTLDVRTSLRTHDGASIVITCLGIGVPQEGGCSIRAAPLFETGDPRYAWLNRVQAVSIGDRRGAALVAYNVYALL